MIIYLDIVFAISTYCHWIILQLTNELVRLRAKWYRILLGSVVASAIIPIVLYFPHSIFTSMVSLIFLSIITILCTFGFWHIRFIGKILFTFYFVTFTIGGGLLALYFSGLFNKLTITNYYDEKISALFVLVGVPSIFVFIRYIKKKLEKDKLIYDEILEIKIQINGQELETKGFIDSGNQLTDPISRRPVAVCEESFIKGFFSDNDWSQLKIALKENKIDSLPDHLKKLLYVVPFHTVGGESNIIYTLKPQKLTINYQGKILTMNKILIGINWTHLISNRSYECLLHPEMVHSSKIKVA